MSNKLLYSRPEVAELIGVSLATVEALTDSGQLASVKVGRSVRVSADALAEFAKTGTQNKTADGRPLNKLWQARK